MIIYPAIDIKDGKCVRLTQGKFEEEKVYFENPQEVAKLWRQKGAKALHIVDLDGALEGRSKNFFIVEKILQEVDIPIQFGGGIRSLETIKDLIQIGVSRVILGTKALEDKEMLKRAIDLYLDKVIVSIDAKEGYVALEGWQKTSRVQALDFAKEIQEMGIKTIVYTDISRDGMLEGPNFDAIRELKKHVTMDIVASGGITSLEDVKELSQIGVAGCIIGKALYEGKIDLSQIQI